MNTGIFTFGIIFIFIGIMGLVACYYSADIDDVKSSLIMVIVFLFFGAMAVVYGLCHKPTEEDVLAGKAVYQETITITQTGDSIKTYQIVWKEK